MGRFTWLLHTKINWDAPSSGELTLRKCQGDEDFLGVGWAMELAHQNKLRVGRMVGWMVTV